jgi:hypothetical protein
LGGEKRIIRRRGREKKAKEGIRRKWKDFDSLLSFPSL